MSVPKTLDILRAVNRFSDLGAHSLRRFQTGLAHYVYDVTMKDGGHLVVRMADRDHWNGIPGGVYWHPKLTSIGVPLPKLLDYELQGENPYMLLERLPGEDLGAVYGELSAMEKQGLVDDILRIQGVVAQLPSAGVFGWLESYQPRLFYKTWLELLQSELEKTESLLEKQGVVDPNLVVRVRAQLNHHENYFARVQPLPFLDDTTTKNVLLINGSLSGIVDIDVVCFGDRLFALALTQMALLSDRQDTEYVRFWAEGWELSSEEVAVLKAYTAYFCVGFMAELGRGFNREGAGAVPPDRIELLHTILFDLLSV